MKQKRRSPVWGILIPALLALAAALWFFTAVGNIHTGQREQGRDQLELALRRAAVACYAAEGVYPPDVRYLEQHYGVQIDETRYAVFYDIFAGNLMPDITVLERDP